MSEQAARDYARERHFSAATTERWLRCAARDGLLDLAVRLRLGENQFRDLLDLLEDCAVRHRCDARAVLELPPVSAVLRGKLGRNDTIKALKAALRRLRYPQLSATEERLKDLARSLALPRAVQIGFPDHLEGTQLTLTVQAGSATELRGLLGACARAAERAEVDEMFRLLDGQGDPA